MTPIVLPQRKMTVDVGAIGTTKVRNRHDQEAVVSFHMDELTDADRRVGHQEPRILPLDLLPNHARWYEVQLRRMAKIDESLACL
jgi:hypothetical protein